MGLAPRRWAAELLHVWFYRLRPADWWSGSARVDALIEARFADEWRALRTCAPETFLSEPQTALAAVLLFDQVPRNLFRDDPRAYATDPLARAICHGALALGYLDRLGREQQAFLVMPLMHSEAIADQRLSLRLFTQVNGGSNLAFARSHYRMIARFGRFPHRNAVLARDSTAAEKRAVEAGFAW